jgi:hypothetical protein
MDKKIFLLSVSILATSLFFVLPQNREWMAQRVLAYWNDFRKQKNLNPEHRKIERYGTEYTYSKRIAGFFRQKGIEKNVLVLFPPTAYFKSKGIDYHVPEPAVFYYFTGLKTIWVDSRDAIKANWVVRVDSTQMVIDSVLNTAMLADTIQAFKKFPVSL